MEAKIIKDVALKDKILGEVKSEIIRLEEIHNKRPGIAFVGFMGVPLGKYNIPFHVQLAEGLGFQVFNEIQPDDITEADLFKQHCPAATSAGASHPRQDSKQDRSP